MAGEENNESQKKQGLMDWLSFGMGSIGDIFSWLFWGALLVAGAYFLCQVPAIRDFIQENLPSVAAGLNKITGGRLFPGAMQQLIDGMSAEDARKTLPEQGGVPQNIADIIAHDEPTWKDFKDLVKTANNGVLDADTPMSDKTIFAMLTSKRQYANPAMARALIDKMPQDSGAQPSATTTQLLTSVSLILKDQKRLNTILHDGDAFNVVSYAMEKFSKPGITRPGALGAFIKNVGTDAQGNATPQMQTLITSLVDSYGKDGGADAMRKSLLTFVTQSPQLLAHPEALSTLAASLNLADLKPEERGNIAMLANPQFAKQFVLIAHELGPDKVEQAMQVMKDKGYAGLIDLASHDKDVQAALTKASIPGSAEMTAAMHNPQVMGAVTYLNSHGIDSNTVIGTFTSGAAAQPSEVIDNVLDLTYGNAQRGVTGQLDALLNGNNLGQFGTLVDYTSTLVKGQAKEGLSFLAAKAPIGPNQLAYVNLYALVHAADQLRDPSSGNHGKAIRDALHSLGMVASGDSTQFINQLVAPAEAGQANNEMTNLFGNPYNKQVIGDMLKTMNAHAQALDPQARGMLNLLTTHWPAASGILGNPKQAKLLGAILKADKNAFNKISAADITAFFGNDGNVNMMRDTLKMLHDHPPVQFTKEGKTFIDQLYTNYDNLLVPMLRNPTTVSMAMDSLHGKSDGQIVLDRLSLNTRQAIELGTVVGIPVAGLDYLITNYDTLGSAVTLYSNRDTLKDMQHSYETVKLQVDNVQHNGGPAHTPGLAGATVPTPKVGS